MALVMILAPLQVQALSCAPWQVEDAFSKAAQSKDSYLIVRGKLTFAQRDMPKVDWNRQQDVPPLTKIKARLKGKSLGLTGYETKFSAPVTFLVSCAGPWCPSASSRSDVLAFVKKSGNRYEIELGACGGMVFENPTQDMIERVNYCFSEGACSTPHF